MENGIPNDFSISFLHTPNQEGNEKEPHTK